MFKDLAIYIKNLLEVFFETSIPTKESWNNRIKVNKETIGIPDIIVETLNNKNKIEEERNLFASPEEDTRKEIEPNNNYYKYTIIVLITVAALGGAYYYSGRNISDDISAIINLFYNRSSGGDPGLGGNNSPPALLTGPTNVDTPIIPSGSNITLDSDGGLNTISSSNRDLDKIDIKGKARALDLPEETSSPAYLRKELPVVPSIEPETLSEGATAAGGLKTDTLVVGSNSPGSSQGSLTPTGSGTITPKAEAPTFSPIAKDAASLTKHMEHKMAEAKMTGNDNNL
jgi:hypothetical protein